MIEYNDLIAKTLLNESENTEDFNKYLLKTVYVNI